MQAWADRLSHRVPSSSSGIPLLIWLWTAVTGLVIFGLFHAWAFDDPFITFRYSANLAQGAGFVYNPGQPILSTTTPLYTLLLVLPSGLGLDLPTVSNLIGAISLALGGLAFWQLGQTWSLPLVGWTGLLLWPWVPQLAGTLGGEAPFYLALALWGLAAYGQSRYGWAGLLLALAILTRADGVLLAGLLVLHFFLFRRPGEAIPWRALLPGIGILVLWALWAWTTFGSPLPVTLAAKQQQGLMAISQGFAQGFPRTFSVYWDRPWLRLYPTLMGIGLLTLLLLSWRRRGHAELGWLLPPIWAGLYFVAYTWLGVTRYFWYYAPLVPGFITLIGLGVMAVTAPLAKGSALALTRHRDGSASFNLLFLARVLASVLTLALLFIPQFLTTIQFSHMADPRIPVYRAAGEWLAAHTPSDTQVGALEVGALGYYSRRPMVDFAGLIQPDVAQQITVSSTYDDTALWAVNRYRPEYLAVNPAHLPRLMAHPDISAHCEIVQTFTSLGYSGEFHIYHCRWEESSQ